MRPRARWLARRAAQMVAPHCKSLIGRKPCLSRARRLHAIVLIRSHAVCFTAELVCRTHLLRSRTIRQGATISSCPVRRTPADTEAACAAAVNRPCEQRVVACEAAAACAPAARGARGQTGRARVTVRGRLRAFLGPRAPIQLHGRHIVVSRTFDARSQRTARANTRLKWDGRESRLLTQSPQLTPLPARWPAGWGVLRADMPRGGRPGAERGRCACRAREHPRARAQCHDRAGREPPRRLFRALLQGRAVAL